MGNKKRKKRGCIVALFLILAIGILNPTFAAEQIEAIENDKQVKSEVKGEVTKVTTININRCWFCFISKTEIKEKK